MELYWIQDPDPNENYYESATLFCRLLSDEEVADVREFFKENISSGGRMPTKLELITYIKDKNLEDIVPWWKVKDCVWGALQTSRKNILKRKLGAQEFEKIFKKKKK